MFRNVSLLATTLLVSTDSFSWKPPHRGENRLFLDTADTAAWQELLPTGLFYGVTTNPVLLEQSQQVCSIENIHKLAQLALEYDMKQFLCQAWGTSVQEMVKVGEALASYDRKHIVVKLPVTATGIQAATQLMREHKVRICLTACYSRQQALVAASLGVEYVAPYVGRMNDAGKEGMDECLAMMDIVDGLKSETRILVASIRDTQVLTDLAASGMETFTLGPDVARQLWADPLTEQAARDFEESAKRNSQ